MVEFHGLAPVPTGVRTVVFDIEGLGAVNLREDAELVQTTFSAEPGQVALWLDFTLLRRERIEVSLSFSGVRLLKFSTEGTVSPGEETLFYGIDHWDQDGGGFALESELLYFLFAADTLRAMVNSGDEPAEQHDRTIAAPEHP
ncbi:MAG: hypothetical protein ACRDRL_05055 [Sciscionella sp.]